MLSLWKLRVGSEAYYLSQVASGLEDYYSGRGASQLGLSGTVSGEDLRELLAGLGTGADVPLHAALPSVARRGKPDGQLALHRRTA